jgi:PAS domain S-box-containing protein
VGSAGRALVQHLPPALSSPGVARRVVSEALTEWGFDELGEAAQLLVSELVTNAVLHVGTDIEVRTAARRSGVRIEVHDGSDLVPTRRHYGEDAATGRGLGLVESLSSDWGVHRAETGKVVWFELGIFGGHVDRAPGARSPNAQEGVPTGTVQFLGLPAALVHVTLQYGDAVLRELTLLSLAGELGDDVAPVYITPELDLSDIVVAVEGALAEDRPAVDVEVRFPLTQAGAALERLALVDEADRLAHEGRLLSAPAVPEIGACRRWLMSQIAVQLRGEPATPWQLPPIVNSEAEWQPLSREEERSLSAPGVAVMVADAGNRIVFVSEAAAALLGWEPGELTGRRLTTVIPPDLREAHLAGFTRFQVTGKSRLLGQSVRVRALRRDGSEIDVELELDVVHRSQGRQGFRAVITRY